MLPASTNPPNEEPVNPTVNVEPVNVKDVVPSIVPSLIVNGGDPATAGNWNYFIKNTYPSTYIDLWTTGWNTMTIGNGEMADGVHPTNTGNTKLANIIKAARPDLFPL